MTNNLETQMAFDVSSPSKIELPLPRPDAVLGIPMNERMIAHCLQTAITPSKLANTVHLTKEQVFGQDPHRSISSHPDKIIMGLFFEVIFRYFSGNTEKDLLLFLKRKDGELMKILRTKNISYRWRDAQRQADEANIAEWLANIDENTPEGKDLLYWLAHKALLSFAVFRQYFASRRRGSNDKLQGSTLHQYSLGQKIMPSFALICGPDYISDRHILETKLNLTSSGDNALIQLAMAKLLTKANMSISQKKGKIIDFIKPSLYLEGETDSASPEIFAYSYADGKLLETKKLDLGQFVKMLGSYTRFSSEYAFYKETLAKHRHCKSNKYLLGLGDRMAHVEFALEDYQAHAREFLSSCECVTIDTQQLYTQMAVTLNRSAEQMQDIDRSVSEFFGIKSR